jgi:hypothetical protein
MKPKEFDELIRQKFDQNDLAYDPRNWDRLEEQMDGRAKKRSIMMWWLMPLAGVAASVALALGVSTLLRQPGPASPASDEAYVQPFHSEQHTAIAQDRPLQDNSVAGGEETAHNRLHLKAAKNTRRQHDENDGFAIRMENAIGYSAAANKKSINLLKAPVSIEPKDKKKAPQVAIVDGISTFKQSEEQAKPAPKLSVILSTGISHGAQNSGYTAGATIRKMVNDKVYIESDVAFATSSNTHATLVQVTAGGTPAAKFTTAESNRTTVVKPIAPTYKEENQSYDLNYVQVTPSLGVKLARKMSIGIGPDFQQMLADNRPAPSAVDKGNIAVDPTFDVGFIGKTEYSVTKKIKAAVSYRKGINNVLTPMDKYIDRDYLQFQLKCIIFNK